MSLLKVIMTSATVATAAFTGISSEAPVAKVSVGQYAMASEENNAFAVEAEIYDAICVALAESFDSREAALARYFWTADGSTDRADDNGMLSGHPVSAKKQSSPKKAVTNAGSGTEVLAADTADQEIKIAGGGTEGNAGAGVVINNSSAEIMADAGKADEPAPAAGADTSVKTAENSFTEAVDNQGAFSGVDGDSTSGRTGRNESVAAAATPATPDSNPAAGGGSASAAAVPGSNSVDAGSISAPVPAPAVPAAVPDSNSAEAVSSSEPAPAPAVPAVVPDSNPADTDAGDTPAPAQVASADNGPRYDHTTSIYTNDESTLLRVEYYDENNKLFEYSSVENYNKDTNSYTETVYKWDNESNTQVTVRTDTYENGELVSSEQP